MIEQFLPASADATSEQISQSPTTYENSVMPRGREQVAKSLRNFRGGEAKPLLVCFSHLRWDFVWQRPQHLLTRAAAHFEVVFVEEPVFEANVRPFLSLSSRENGVCVATPHLPLELGCLESLAAQHDLVESLLATRRGRQTIFWFYTPMALGFTEGLDRDVTAYDNMDELSAFRGASPELLAREDALFRQADIVFTGGVSLYEAKRGRHSNLHCFPSSIDVSHFARTRLLAKSRKARSRTSPRIGFFGVIDERLDTGLVEQIAALRPEWQIEMVGPIAKIDPSNLVGGANLKWLGPCPYAGLPDKLAEWDVGIMPFAINEATRFISPTKTPEFLAAGLPVVSTAIADVMRTYGQQGLVEIAATPTSFVSAIERVLLRPRKPWLDAVDRHLATMSWDATWAAMHALVVDGNSRASLPQRKSGSNVWERGSLPAAKSALNMSAAESV